MAGRTMNRQDDEQHLMMLRLRDKGWPQSRIAKFCGYAKESGQQVVSRILRAIDADYAKSCK